jgi:hypothetical protein
MKKKIVIRDISHILTKYLFEARGGERATSSNKYRNTCGRQRRRTREGYEEEKREDNQ